MTKAETFSVEIGVQRVDEEGGQTFLKKKPEDVVAVVSGSLKPYFYVVCRVAARPNPLQQGLKAIYVVGDGEHIGQHFVLRTEDKAVMFVLRYINSNANHDDTSRAKMMMLHPQNTLPCSLVLHKPPGGI